MDPAPSELRAWILHAVAKHNGEWYWWQMDRALSSEGKVEWLPYLVPTILELKSEGLIEYIKREDVPNIEYYALTTAGRNAVGALGVIADIERLGQNRRIGDSVMSTAKEELTRLIEKQPDDSSREEIVRELAFHVMVERGLADSDAKRTISNEEMGRRIRSWQK